jgi:hypothetical protein
MPLTEDLKVGDMVCHRNYAVRLTAKVNDIGDNAYWWVETLFTDKPEVTMLAFRHHTAISSLHTKAA